MSILGNSKIVPAVVPTVGSVAVITATAVNTTGFDRVCFLFATGAAAVGATIDLKLIKSATSNMQNPADVTGGAFTQLTAAASASKTFAIDVPVDPAKPYMALSGEVKVGTFANGAVAVLYEGSGRYPKTAATEAILL